MATTARERRERGARRWWRGPVLGLAAVVVLALAWAGWTVWQVQRDVTAARSAAVAIPVQLTQDRAEADRLADTLGERAASARERTSGPTWRVLEAMPFVGGDFGAVARAARAVDTLAREGVRPLVDSGLGVSTFAPKDGRLPVGSIARAAGPLAEARTGFESAQAELDPIEVSSLARELRPGVQGLVDEVDDGVRTLDAAVRAAEVLPAMLGRQGPRDYLVVFQNNAEPRSLGGMPGLMTPLTVRDGELLLGRTVATSEFGELDRPVLSLTKEERAIWREQPATWFQDSVFIPDFPRASELMAARWRLETGKQVDGVISLDPVALSYLLEATGPVTVDGRRLTSDNFVDEILHAPYLRYDGDPQAEDAFFGGVLDAVFERLLGPTVSPAKLMDGLSRAAAEGRVLVHSSDPAEQEKISGTRIAGELPDETGGYAQAGVYVNDATGSKMGYYLDYQARVSGVSCASGVIGFSGSLRIHSTAPADVAQQPVGVTGPGTYGVARGDHLNVFDLVAPTGGEITDVVVNGVKSRGTNRVYRGRPIVSIPVLLTPGDVVTLTWKATSGPGHTGGVEFVSTPGVSHGGGKQVVAAPCGEGRL